MIFLASIVARATRNNYEAALMEPLLLLTSALSIWLARKDLIRIFGEARVIFYSRAFFGGLVALSIVSQITFLIGYCTIC